MYAIRRDSRAGGATRIQIYRAGWPRAEAVVGEGWFSSLRLSRDAEAAALLFREMRAAQSGGSLTGPVSPNACGFGEGVLTEGFGAPSGPMNPRNGDWYASLLRDNGFRAETTYLGYSLDVSRVDHRLFAAAERRDVTARVSMLDREAVRRMRRVMAEDAPGGEEAFFRACGVIADACRARVVTAERRGEATGFVLLLDGRFPRRGMPRVATCWVRRDARRGATLLCIAACAGRVLLREGRYVADVSVVDETNAASRAVVEGLGGLPTRKYTRFHSVL